jgi:hypothetical protein
MQRHVSNLIFMIKDTIDSFKRVVNERISNPFLGAFVLFWLALNWATIAIVLMSKKPIEDTIVYVSQNQLSIFRSVVSPLIFASLFNIIFPWISYWVSWYNDFVEIKKRCKHVEFEVAVLNAKKSVFLKEYEIEEIKLDREHKREDDKLRLMHMLEEQKRQVNMSEKLSAVDSEYAIKDKRMQHEWRPDVCRGCACVPN